ncbi:MAG: dimethylamine monooxygenase subunit DmmA family protein [Paracoccus sp. (in: a-proteobacteria)]|uniref:dimethylamine monooxygenase subunit DmmA family protein n=1 Tax=Paracoccus sp. TaxID=267 RepID=UPI0026E0DE45|nr:dimethylamine monooxygenase subunit DmmA family protein [Paracoccus sp. (in: a-proteobacteria)]MDO5630786.1 dimethylamine monooxygenase subunit DmmA family protein [Paracoccus sp. (in: a-proteobacteria)]
MSSLPPSSLFVSRPVYARLEPRPCSAALMICDDNGAAALADLGRAAPDLMTKTTIIHVAATARPGALIDLARRYDETSDLNAAIDAAMANARMGLQVFLAGSEGVIAQAQARLLLHGVPLGAIQSEHRGTAARRMQCVHCKTIAENVTTDPYTCPGCGRALFVRDHFSRRLGAFQGVCVDAETPGIIPDPVEIRL